MKLAPRNYSLDDLQGLIQSRFADFNRRSNPSRGRRYPPDLRELVRRGHAAGLFPKDLKRLTGMSQTAIQYTLSKAQLVPPRRLEVVGHVLEPLQAKHPLVIRLPSGISIELTDANMLTTSLLSALAKLELNHASSR